MSDFTAPPADVADSFRRMAEDLEQENIRLRLENHRLQELVTAADALVARKGDEIQAAKLQHTRDVLRRVMARLDKKAMSVPEDQAAFRAAWAVLAEGE